MKEKIAVKFYLDIEGHRELKVLAAKEGNTMTEIILDAIDAELERRAREEQTSIEHYRRILQKRTAQEKEALRRHNKKIAADPAIQLSEEQAALYDANNGSKQG